MYSNDLTQIRAGLVNYIGACVAASPFEGRAARHTVVSIMMEESLKLSQEKDGEPFDLYVLKPMLRATSLVIKQRKAELEKLPRSQEVKGKIGEYEQLAKQLDDIIKLINS